MQTATVTTDLIAFARDNNSNDLVVTRGGATLVDESWGPRMDVASVQKSMTSVLVGVALAEQKLTLDDTVTSYLGAGWTGRDDVATEAEITLRHLLTMTSGLGSAMEFVAKPGEWWNYNLVAYPLAKRVLTAAMGEDLNTLTARYVTGPLGMTETTWELRVWDGTLPELLKPAFFYPDGQPMDALISRARDLARFGNGPFTGLDLQYQSAMTQPSQDLNPAYGYLWWTNAGGRQWPGVPKDAYAALGMNDQCCVVIPSEGLVVARTGAAPTTPNFVPALVRHAIAAQNPTG